MGAGSLPKGGSFIPAGGQTGRRCEGTSDRAEKEKEKRGVSVAQGPRCKILQAQRLSTGGTFASPVPEEKRRRQGESKQDRSASHLGQQPLSFLVKRRQRKRPGERRFSLANRQARGSGGQAALPTTHLHFKQPVCFISSLAYSPCAEKQSIKRDLAPRGSLLL